MNNKVKKQDFDYTGKLVLDDEPLEIPSKYLTVKDKSYLPPYLPGPINGSTFSDKEE
jgi:hypothetical protein